MFHNSICLNFKVDDSAKILLDMLFQKKADNKLPTDAVQHLRRSKTRPPHPCVFTVRCSGTISLYWAAWTLQMQKAASFRTSAAIYQFTHYHNQESWNIYIYATMLIKYAIYLWAILQAVMMHPWLYPRNSINDLNQWYINYLHFPFHVGYCLQNQISTKAIWTSSLKTWLCSCDASAALIMIPSLNVLQKNIWA